MKWEGKKLRQSELKLCIIKISTTSAFLNNKYIERRNSLEMTNFIQETTIARKEKVKD